MADDLIIKFFKEDLSEAEESALSDRLSSSIEDALRFGQHAEASYRHYGLPEPQWRGGPPPGFYSKSGLKFGLWLPVIFLAGLSTWGGWKYWTGNGNKLSLNAPGVSVPGLAPSSEKKPQHTAPIPQKEVIPDLLRPEAVQPADETSSNPGSSVATNPASAKGALAKPEQPALTPVNAATQAHHPHSNLEVLVKQAKPGTVTVRVVEPDGSQAVMLYQGLLQPGSWIFDWNGRLADGSPPPAGTYQIQVVSGAVTLHKDVVIRK
ncbi:MAG TPA: hypothetical protein VJ873_08005 [bacterium]|nr:hypothetical protein [bacterium]